MERFLIAGLAVSLLLVSTGSVVAATERSAVDSRNESNETAKLWAGDADNYLNSSAYAAYARQHDVPATRSALAQALNATDWTWRQPPALPAQWNRDAFDTLEQRVDTGPDTSIHPSDVARQRDEELGIIQDAHATTFALQPSTRAYQGETPSTYVAPSGAVRALVDYRVKLPGSTTQAGHTVRWSMQDHRIDEVCLLQGQTVTPETENPCQSDAAISSSHDSKHFQTLRYQTRTHGATGTTLTLAAEIEATVQKTVVPDCEGRVCGEPRQETQQVSVTVSDTRRVQVYDGRATVRHAQYPDGDMGLVVRTDLPWAGVQVQGERIATPWRLFTTATSQWQTLVTERASTQSRTSLARPPVQVQAVPSTAPVQSFGRGRQDLELVDHVSGEETPTASEALPAGVHVSAVSGSHQPTRTIAVRTAASATPAVQGLVRSASPTVYTVDERVQIRESNLSLQVLEANTTHAVVAVQLSGNATGRPIGLRDRSGAILVQGRSVLTNDSGVAVATVPYNQEVTAQYQPASWWTVQQPYVGDSASVQPDVRTFTAAVTGQLLVRGLVFSLPFLFVLFLIDQIPGATTWPPWRLFR